MLLVRPVHGVPAHVSRWLRCVALGLTLQERWHTFVVVTSTSGVLCRALTSASMAQSNLRSRRKGSWLLIASLDMRIYAES